MNATATLTKHEADALEAKVVHDLAERPTERLVEMFEETDKQRGLDVATVRGWLMDALEAQHPERFAAWIDGDFDGSPRQYFVES